MKQRIHRGWLVALVLLVGLLLPLRRATGQESASPAPAASQTAPVPSTSTSPYVMTDGNGNVLVHSTETESARPGTSTLSAGLNVPSGMAVVTTHMTVPDAKDATGSGYLEANAKKIYGLGSFNATLDPKDKPPILDLYLAGKQDSNTSSAKGTLSAEWDNDKPVQLTAASLDLNATATGYKASQSTTHLTIQGDQIKTGLTPTLKSADIKITEAQGVTTINASIAVPGASQLAASFKQIQSSPTEAEQQISQTLSRVGFMVQSVKLSNVHATNDEAGLDATIVIKDTRKTLQTLLQAGMARLGSAVDSALVTKGLDELLEIQLDTLEVKADTSGDKFDLAITGNVTNLDKFVLGYIDVYSAIIPAMQKMQTTRRQTPMNEFLLNAGVLSLQRFRTVWEQASANSSDKWSIKLSGNLGFTGNHAKLTANLDSTGDVKSLVAAAKAASYPMMETQYVLLRAKSDGKTANGTAYLDASGAWFDGLKAPYAEAARQTKGMEELATILPALQFTDAKMSFDLNNTTLTGNGYVQLSDLTPVVKTALQKNAPKFTGDLVAVNVVSENAAGAAVHNSGDLYFANMPKSESDVKADLANLGELGSLPVKSGSGKDTTPPALSKPTVTMPNSLNTVADDARKELGISALPVPGVPGGKTVPGSNTNLMLLIAGIAIIVIVGLAAASKGGKKA